jgi:hypothetical protein
LTYNHHQPLKCSLVRSLSVKARPAWKPNELEGFRADVLDLEARSRYHDLGLANLHLGLQKGKRQWLQTPQVQLVRSASVKARPACKVKLGGRG